MTNFKKHENYIIIQNKVITSKADQVTLYATSNGETAFRYRDSDDKNSSKFISELCEELQGKERQSIFQEGEAYLSERFLFYNWSP